MRDTMQLTMEEAMNFKRAEQLQKRMPWKQIFFDAIHKCYRLIAPSELYEYKDEEGKYRLRSNVSSLVKIS